MGKGFSGGRGYSSRGGSSGKSSFSGRASSWGTVSSARLRQKAGSANSFGGYTKVHLGGDRFVMRPSNGKGK